ncbi:hypothetical protein VTN31DRAFT_3547 [Thermomyces dupontii]|uniref:uncharacterized protein n=1 Tax=Talaromyces thermophilus TaxID=28565 RepID=UPI00374261F8
MLRPQPGNPQEDDMTTLTVAPQCSIHSSQSPAPWWPYHTNSTSAGFSRSASAHIIHYHRARNLSSLNSIALYPANKRWVNTPIPRVERGAFVEGHLIGLHGYNGRRSPIINVSEFAFLNGGTSDAPATPASSIPPSTPAWVQLCQRGTVDCHLFPIEPAPVNRFPRGEVARTHGRHPNNKSDGRT